MKQIFLISGLAQSGKDSTAMFLKNNLPGESLILHFADLIKHHATQYLGWDGQKDETGRSLIQYIGTELVREKHQKPLYWVERTCDVIQFLQDRFDYFLVPDTRFKNEIYYPKALFHNFVTTIRVHRLNFDNGLTEEQKNHISERELIGFPHDYEIKCDSGLDKLEREVKKFIFEYYKD